MSNGNRSQIRNPADGEFVTQNFMLEVGHNAQVSAFDGVASLLFSNANGTDLVAGPSGFVGRGCHPKLGGSALAVTIEPGGGFFNRETTGGLDPTAEAYRHSPMFVPFFLLSAETATIGAHHATLPRYDIISMTVSEVDDDADDVRERVSAPGTQQVVSRNTRRRWAPTFAVTAGTANASPSVPSTPAGWLRVAVVYVPATSGNVIVQDARVQAQFGYGLGEPTYPHYAYPAVQSGLGVTPGSGVDVVVAAGYLGSPRRYFESKTLTMSVPGSNSVIHLIYADNATGAINKVNGTPAASPTEPALPTGSTALAYVTIASGAVSIASGDIENVVSRGPYQGPDGRRAHGVPAPHGCCRVRRQPDCDGSSGGPQRERGADGVRLQDGDAVSRRSVRRDRQPFGRVHGVRGRAWAQGHPHGRNRSGRCCDRYGNRDRGVGGHSDAVSGGDPDLGNDRAKP